jgi:hypothetical protein
MTGLAFALPVDGKWSGEMKRNEKSTPISLTITGEGSAAKAVLTTGKKNTQDVSDLKIEGDKISFATTQKSKKGERTQIWEGTISGDEMTLRSGKGKRAAPITLKRG